MAVFRAANKNSTKHLVMVNVLFNTYCMFLPLVCTEHSKRCGIGKIRQQTSRNDVTKAKTDRTNKLFT